MAAAVIAIAVIDGAAEFFACIGIDAFAFACDHVGIRAWEAAIEFAVGVNVTFIDFDWAGIEFKRGFVADGTFCAEGVSAAEIDI